MLYRASHSLTEATSGAWGRWLEQWLSWFDGEFHSLSRDVVYHAVEPNLIKTEMLTFCSNSSRKQNDSDLMIVIL